MTPEHFKALLAKARTTLAAHEQANVDAMEAMIEKEQPNDISVAGTPDSLFTKSDPESREMAIELVGDLSTTVLPAKEQTTTGPEATHHSKLGVARDDISLNARQQEFHDSVVAGKDTVLIGAAGTGKTTSVRQTTKTLLATNRLPKLSFATKHLKHGTPGAVILSYTRKAVNNIRHAVVDELKANTLTIHKLLEYAPMFYEVPDEKNGGFKKTMRFEPTRGAANPLPAELELTLFEESSMISVDLYRLLQDAMPHPHQEVFLGDIQQLKPIFGAAILGFKMIQLPVIELTEVYRQALGSPIISLAWKILGGNANDFHPKTENYKTPEGKQRIRVPSLMKMETSNDIGSLKFQPWQKKLSPEFALNTTIKQFNAWADQGYYNPNDDIILCPFNKSLGTVELNKGIANHLGLRRNAIVHEVIAGFNMHYLAVGDRVLYDKEDAFITSIHRNGSYLGKLPQAASVNLDRWGHLQKELTEAEIKLAEADGEMDLDAIEKFLETASTADVEDRVQAASHCITLQLAATDDFITLEAASEVNALLGGYAITVHKAQGSEWERVFFVMHHSHATMNQRELLYTAVTRARKHLHIICEPETFAKGIRSQQIKGNTIAEKAEEFKGKLDKQTGFGFSNEEAAIKGGKTYVPTFSPMANDGRNHSVTYSPEEIKENVSVKTTQSVPGISQAATNDVTATPTDSGPATASANTLSADRDKLIAAAKAKLAAIKAARK